LVWSTIRRGSDKGVLRLLRRVPTEPLRITGYRCAPTPERQGKNLLWTTCVLERRDAGGRTVAMRLFGSIVERGGAFKFVSYANEF
jgi:hypothetical protein